MISLRRALRWYGRVWWRATEPDEPWWGAAVRLCVTVAIVGALYLLLCTLYVVGLLVAWWGV